MDSHRFQSRNGGLASRPTSFRCLVLGGIAFLLCSSAWSAGTNAVPSGLQDIQGPFEIRSLADVLRLAALVLLLVGLLGLAWWWWRRRKRSVEPTKTIPPEDIARARLKEALALLDQPERFCTTVSEIVRVYLEDRFGLQAPDRTTEEFLSELARSAALEVRHKALLAEFLTGCDLAKFARANPGRAELESLHASGLRLVDETAAWIPVPPPTLTPPLLPSSKS